jgi:hypothetical protein
MTRATKKPMIAYSANIEPVTPRTGTENGAPCLENHRNTQAQVEVKPVTEQSTTTDQSGSRRMRSFNVLSPSTVDSVSVGGIIALSANEASRNTSAAASHSPPKRRPLKIGVGPQRHDQDDSTKEPIKMGLARFRCALVIGDRRHCLNYRLAALLIEMTVVTS